MSAGRNDFKKWFGRDNLVIVILAGILLFVIALPTKERSPKKDNLANEGGEQSTLWAEAEDVAESRQVTGQSQNQEYVAELEEKLSGILSRMSGVGKAEVMITLSASEELVVEKDTPVSRSSTNENNEPQSFAISC